mmetsp:Transcript_121885/g.344745  ORF Transcript_121885/g.344745 Transcript_121885/m.344745 type:complete len:279 (-) Transcript_121885:11-847(-)
MVAVSMWASADQTTSGLATALSASAPPGLATSAVVATSPIPAAHGLATSAPVATSLLLLDASPSRTAAPLPASAAFRLAASAGATTDAPPIPLEASPSSTAASSPALAPLGAALLESLPGAAEESPGFRFSFWPVGASPAAASGVRPSFASGSTLSVASLTSTTERCSSLRTLTPSVPKSTCQSPLEPSWRSTFPRRPFSSGAAKKPSTVTCEPTSSGTMTMAAGQPCVTCVAAAGDSPAPSVPAPALGDCSGPSSAHTRPAPTNPWARGEVARSPRR